MKIDESAAWTRLSRAYAAHFGDPDSIWRVDNKHGRGMADVFMSRPHATWVELKSGTFSPGWLTLKLPLSQPQHTFLCNSTEGGSSAGVLTLTADGWWYCPAKMFNRDDVGETHIPTTPWFTFYPDDRVLIDRFFDELATTR